MKNKILLLIFCLMPHISLTNSDHSNFQRDGSGQREPAAASFEELFLEALQLFREKNYSHATDTYKKALELQPDSYQTWFNYGICLFDSEKLYDALDAFQKAIIIKPDYPRAHHHLSKTLLKLGRTKDAVKHLKTTLEHEPNTIEAYLEVARVYKDQHLFRKALKWIDKGLALESDNIGLLFEEANILCILNKMEESLEIYYALLKRAPNNRALLYNIGYTLKKIGKIRESIIYYDKVIGLYPDHTEAHFSRGLAYLQLGLFEKGWEGYEYRWARSSQKLVKHYPHHPQWDGSDLHSKRIVLYAEQGLGDTFQFIRYAYVAKQKGGYVIAAVQDPLQQILSLCPFIDEVIKLGDTPAQFDVQAALMSLPYILETTIKTVPVADQPYLYADETLVSLWKEKLSPDKNFKIGICWQGNNKYNTPLLRAVVAYKSVELTKMLQYLDLEGITLYSLQKMTGEEQLKKNDTSLLRTFDGDFDNTNGRFMDTAAVMKNLDLIITIDTSICHLAAGLGVPTWNLLPNPYDWRWILNKNDTPWYQSMRLFIQPTPGDWDGVLQQVRSELKKIVPQEKKFNNSQVIPQEKSAPSSIAHELSEQIQSLEYQLV